MSNLLERFDKTILFFLIYSLIFFVFINTLGYTIPFVLALLFAVILKGPTRFIAKHLKLSRTIAALLTTILFYSLLFLLLFWASSAIISEVIELGKTIPNYIPDLRDYTAQLVDNIQTYYNHLDPAIIKAIESSLSDITLKLTTLVNMVVKGVVSFLTNFLSSIPYLIMLFVFTLISTYFFTKDLSSVHDNPKILSAFNDSKAAQILYIYDEAKKMLLNYILSYLLVVTITFVVTLIGFVILRIDYALVLALLCAILDLMPVLGMPLVYIPIIFFQFSNGQYITALALGILYALVFIVRQISEPRIVSTSLGLHPVSVLAAIFIGLKVHGVIGMIFCVFLVVFYNIFRKVNVI